MSSSNSNNTVLTVCAICRNSFEEDCIECQADGTDTTIHPCLLESGVCGHKFHAHCVKRWLGLRPYCPLCEKAWEPDVDLRPAVIFGDDEPGEDQ